MKSKQILPGIHWVGSLDPDLRVFDIVMETQHGTTYNSYLVKDNKVALIETAKERFFSDHLEKISELIDPADIDYIIVNHTEPDHSGSVGRILDLAPKAKVVGSRSAINFLEQIANRTFDHIVVGDGDELDLGSRTLRFISAPFLHWPDSMFTYSPEDRVLFSCDVFGSHYSHEGVFDDLVAGDFDDDARYYFGMIMGPYRGFVRSALSKIKDLEIDIICPGHGPVHRSNPEHIVDLYREWSDEAGGQNYVAIAYISAYGNTGQMAREIASGIEEVVDLPIEVFDISEVGLVKAAEKANGASSLLVGSPTINRDAVKPAWDLLSMVSAITNKNKPAGAFGSYGWSGEAAAMITDRLDSLNFKVVDPLRARLVPSAKELADCRQFGRSFGQLVAKACDLQDRTG